MHTFYRQRFQMHFLNGRFHILFQMLLPFKKKHSNGSKWQLPSIGSGNGMTMNKQHYSSFIIWKIDDLVFWPIFASPSLGFGELKGPRDRILNLQWSKLEKIAWGAMPRESLCCHVLCKLYWVDLMKYWNTASLCLRKVWAASEKYFRTPDLPLRPFH